MERINANGPIERKKRIYSQIDNEILYIFYLCNETEPLISNLQLQVHEQKNGFNIN